VSETEQLAEVPLPLSVQLVLVGDTPPPLAVKSTFPVGVEAVPVDVSVTVAVQSLEPPTLMGLAQLTLVDVVRGFTVWLTEAEVLLAKLPSVT
jgi:hypothetical protein